VGEEPTQFWLGKNGCVGRKQYYGLYHLHSKGDRGVGLKVEECVQRPEAGLCNPSLYNFIRHLAKNTITILK